MSSPISMMLLPGGDGPGLHPRTFTFITYSTVLVRVSVNSRGQTGGQWGFKLQFPLGKRKHDGVTLSTLLTMTTICGVQLGSGEAGDHLPLTHSRCKLMRFLERFSLSSVPLAHNGLLILCTNEGLKLIPPLLIYNMLYAHVWDFPSTGT